MTSPAEPPRPESARAVDAGTVPAVASARVSTLAKVVIGVVVFLALGGVVGTYVRVPYVIFSPGDATPVDEYLRIRGAESYRHRGSLLLLTVRVSNGRPNLWRFVEASLDDDSRVIGEKQYLGNVPRGRIERQSVQMMDESQLAAKQAALDTPGVPRHGDREGRARGAGRPGFAGDRGRSAGRRRHRGIDGTPIAVRDQVGQIVQAQPVGTTFTVTVRRGDRDRVLEVTSGAAPSGEIKGKPYFGIGAATEDLESTSRSTSRSTRVRSVDRPAGSRSRSRSSTTSPPVISPAARRLRSRARSTAPAMWARWAAYRRRRWRLGEAGRA